MMRRGYLLNVTALLLIIPLLLLAATYQQTSSYIIKSQSQRTLLERQYFSINDLQSDLQNTVELSFKRAYLTLTEYVITNNFVNNASLALKDLMVYGTLNGVPQKSMGNITLQHWFESRVNYLNSIGLRLEPSNPDELVNHHLDITIGPLDSFHVMVQVKILNITVVDSSGTVRYSGDIPNEKNKYIYSTVSVVGFEDPFIVRELNGLYTRIITPCKIPFPGNTYGYYNASNQNDIDDLVLNWCYIGLQDDPSKGMYYPTILDRFEGSLNHHSYYIELAREFQRELGFPQPLPVGLETFLVPDSSIDPTFTGALASIGASVPSNYTSVSYYFLKCIIDGDSTLCKNSVWQSSEYPAFQLDASTKELVFGG